MANHRCLNDDLIIINLSESLFTSDKLKYVDQERQRKRIHIKVTFTKQKQIQLKKKRVRNEVLDRKDKAKLVSQLIDKNKTIPQRN